MLPLQRFNISIQRTTQGSPFRFVVVVPVKTHASSVGRHEIKRKVSEAIRRIMREHQGMTGIRAVIRVGIKELLSHIALEKELLSLMQKSAILVQ